MSDFQGYPLYADWHLNATAERLNELVRKIEVRDSVNLGIEFNIHEDWSQGVNGAKLRILSEYVMQKRGFPVLTKQLSLYDGWYAYLLGNGLGFDISRDGALWREPVGVVPTFTTQPQSISIDEFGVATFSCQMEGGVLPYTYQWKRNGINVGTNSSTLSLTTSSTDKDAIITVNVTDGAGIVVSSIPTLLGVNTTRNFTTFDPVLQTHMTMQTPKTFAGDFEIEFTFSTTSISSLIFMGDSHLNSYYFNSDTKKFSAWVSGVEYIFLYGALTPRDGKLHKLVYRLIGSQLTAHLDGQQVQVARTITPYRGLNNFKIGVANSASAYFNGTIANVTLTDLTTPSNSESWKLDRPIGTNTEQSSSGNNLLTYVNATKRELFTKVGNDWLGAERVVNGGFDSDTVWSKEQGATVSGGLGNLSSQINSVIQQYAPVATGFQYRVKWDVVAPSTSTGVVWSATGCWGSLPFNPSVAGSNSRVFLCVNGSAPMRVITSATNNAMSFDNVSVKRILEVA